MKNTGERQSVFKKGKGRAFLKFLIGELLLVAVVGVVYLFILQGDIGLLLPAAVKPEPTPVVTATPEPTATATPEPTAVVTIAPTAEPTPAPSATPVPYEMLSEPLGEEAPEAPVLPDEALKLGLSEFKAFTEAGQSVLVVKGHAYIEGMDAANSEIYLVVADAGLGQIVDMYQAVCAPETASLTFDETSGTNLANAFFTASLDVSEYPDSAYMLSVVVVNGDRAAMNYYDNRTIHFSIRERVLSVEN